MVIKVPLISRCLEKKQQFADIIGNLLLFAKNSNLRGSFSPVSVYCQEWKDCYK